MDQKKLNKIIESHGKWLRCEGGERADLAGANLACADLTGASLYGANLTRANLTRANLAGANLAEADLTEADLTRACLAGAVLTRAVLTRANLDFSSWPLWCGSNDVIVDDRIARQLAAHFCAVRCDSEEFKAAREAILEYAKGSHRAEDLWLLRGVL
jgi:uncharacterized protein YjbI with pentapeptide repeats